MRNAILHKRQPALPPRLFGATNAQALPLVDEHTSRRIINTTIQKEMKMFRGVLFLISLLLMLQLQSCNSQTMTIDDVIDKYNDADFSELKGISIYFRSAGHQRNSSIYFVNKFKGNCSPYVVEFNNTDKTIVEIKNNLVLKSCKEDYLSKEQIAAVVKKYVEYKLCLLQVDNDGNVYINPDKQELPVYLRKSPNSTPRDLNKFRHYKGDWYVKK